MVEQFLRARATIAAYEDLLAALQLNAIVGDADDPTWVYQVSAEVGGVGLSVSASRDDAIPTVLVDDYRDPGPGKQKVRVLIDDQEVSGPCP
jgi:hypothetical protein